LVTNIPFDQLDFHEFPVASVQANLGGGYLVFDGVTDTSLFNTPNVVQMQTSEIYNLGSQAKL
jgi:hypothetical protein